MDLQSPPPRGNPPETQQPAVVTAKWVPHLPPSPPMLIVTKGWWYRPDEEATVEELEAREERARPNQRRGWRWFGLRE